MTLKESFLTCTFEKYTDFKGKASRSEYWSFWGVYWLVLLGLSMFTFILGDFFGSIGGEESYSAMFVAFLSVIWFLGLQCPFFAVSVRRLRDAGYSGWHLLWCFIPYIGGIITLILMCQKSKTTNTHPISQENK